MNEHPHNEPPDQSSIPRGLEFYEELLASVEGDQQNSATLERLAHHNPLGLAQEKASIRTVLQVLEDARLVELTPTQQAQSRGALKAARRAETESGWRRLVACLVAGTQKRSLALRRGPGSSVHGAFSALFEIDEFELDLRISEEGALMVQLISKQDEDTLEGDGIAILQTKGGDLMTSPINEAGEFNFASVPREIVDITVSLPNLEISLGDVDLQST